MLAVQNSSEMTYWGESLGFMYNYTVHYSARPQRTPMMFLCGAFQSKHSWNRFIKYFSQVCDVIVVELPGNGESDLLPASFGVEYYRTILLDVLDALDIDKVYLVGGSYGTLPAYDFSLHYPQRIDRIVLAGTMRKLPEHLLGKILDTITLLQLGKLDEFINLVVDFLGPDNTHGVKVCGTGVRILKSQLRNFTEMQQQKYIENTRRLLSLDSLTDTPASPVRTLVFTGALDQFTTASACQEFASKIDGAEFTLIKDTGHLFQLENFAVTAKLIDYFACDMPVDRIEGCTGYRKY